MSSIGFMATGGDALSACVFSSDCSAVGVVSDSAIWGTSGSCSTLCA